MHPLLLRKLNSGPVSCQCPWVEVKFHFVELQNVVESGIFIGNTNGRHHKLVGHKFTVRGLALKELDDPVLAGCMNIIICQVTFSAKMVISGRCTIRTGLCWRTILCQIMLFACHLNMGQIAQGFLLMQRVTFASGDWPVLSPNVLWPRSVRSEAKPFCPPTKSLLCRCLFFLYYEDAIQLW